MAVAGPFWLSDSRRGRDWGRYLDEAERNRDALAALGVVRSAEQLGGHSMISLGPRRPVVAFDRRPTASTCSGRWFSRRGVLGRIDVVTKSVGMIRQHAGVGDTAA